MFASMPGGYATAANAAHGQQLPCLINGSTTAAGMGRTPIRVQPDAQNTGSVGKLTRLDRQNDHSIRQLGDDTSTPTVQVHSFEAVAAQAQSVASDQSIFPALKKVNLGKASWRILIQLCQLANSPSSLQPPKKESHQAAAAVTGKRTLDGAAAPATSSPSRSAVAALRVHPRCPWPVL